MHKLLFATLVAVTALPFGASAGVDVEGDIEKTAVAGGASAGGLDKDASAITLASGSEDDPEGSGPESSGIDPKEGPDPE